MRIIKISVVFIFVLAALFGFGSKFFEPKTNAQTSLSAPTGVTATSNLYNNKVGIYWDTMRGATNYRIFRNTVNDSGTATDIGVTPMGFFFDTTAPAGRCFSIGCAPKMAQQRAVSAKRQTVFAPTVCNKVPFRHLHRQRFHHKEIR